ncbi:MAG TPA: DUF397 domain-containing protein [Actinoplanes sp.]|nr:DUF397 domain-containing protein [Actinoplanes sp.]
MSRTTTVWRKSSFCSDSACVEVAFEGDVVAVRDGKDPALDALTLTRAQWDAFVRGIKNDEFRPF